MLDGLKPVSDDMGYVSIPAFEHAIVGYTHLKQATVYDIGICRGLLAALVSTTDPYELECELLKVIKKAEAASGIAPIFIETLE